MKTIVPMPRRVGRLGIAVLLGGCGLLSPVHDSSRFYTLTRSAAPATEPRTAGFVLGLSRVSVPGYLRPSELVTRVGDTELRYTNAARWAEPLDQAITRVLGEDLANELGAQHVLLNPAPLSRQVDWIVRVTILRFEPTSAGVAELRARWLVREPDTGNVRAVREETFQQPIRTALGYDASVEALSATLGDLSTAILDSVRALGPPAPPPAPASRKPGG